MDSAPVTMKDKAALAEFARRVRAALGSNLVDLRLYGSKAVEEGTGGDGGTQRRRGRRGLWPGVPERAFC
jgi:hypothetical protein